MKKKLLLHICCAPCLIVPAQYLSEDYDITALWYNPNIQPMTEYFKRVDAVRQYTLQTGIACEYIHEYDPVAFFRNVVYHEHARCAWCYAWRLKGVVNFALAHHFDCFSTTLLQSHQQDYDLIIKSGYGLTSGLSMVFLPFNFKDRWREGVVVSKQMSMYRQQYCGCVYSEYDRYHDQFRKEYLGVHENRTL